MKLKITVLTGFVLFTILCVFDIFIFFTLDTHLRSTSMADEQNRVQSMAQEARNNINGQTGGEVGYPHPTVWMSKFVRENETAYLIEPNGQIVAHVGELPVTLQNVPVINSAKSRVFMTHVQNLPYYVADAPIYSQKSNTLLGTVVLLQQGVISSEYMHELLTLLLLGSIGAVLLTAAASYFVASTSVRPLSRMMKQIEEIEASKLEYRVKVPSTGDEIEQLAAAFNRMLSRIEQSWNQQARFVADASHELRTPVAAIAGYVNLLRRWGKSNPQVLDEAIGVIQTESARMHALTEDLLLLTKPEAAVIQDDAVSNVREVTREALALVSPLYPEVAIHTDVADVEVQFAPPHLKRVLINVIDNACKYSVPHGRVLVTSMVHKESMSIVVEDSGIGIPEVDLPHIFERFYRVDKSRQRGGSGLGLALVRELVASHQGTVQVDSQLGTGTRVTVTILIQFKSFLPPSSTLPPSPHLRHPL